ncbi:MAG: ATP-dependent DNA ligase [Acidobacteriaceae bacterium]
MIADDVSWLKFAELCELLAKTRSKLAKRKAMADFLRALDAHVAGLAAQYLTGAVFPETDERKLQVGGQLAARALETITQVTPERFGVVYRKHGDLGATAEELLVGINAQSSGLGLLDIAARLDALAAARTQAAKQAQLVDLLRALAPVEAKYAIKLMLGDMRMGVKQSLVEEAIAAASDEGLVEVRRAETMLGDIAAVVALAWRHELSSAQFRMFHPLGFMLATPAANAEDAYARFPRQRQGASPEPTLSEAEGSQDDNSFVAGRTEKADQLATVQNVDEPTLPSARRESFAQIEDKYDGMRAQIHCGDPEQPGRVRIFSRTRDDVTASFPELAEWFACVDGPGILDGEILAWDFDAERALPFTALQQRLGRKRVTAAMRAAAPVVYLAFDLLLDDNRLLLDAPLRQRRPALETWTIAALQAAGKSRRRSEENSAQSSLFVTDEVPNVQNSLPPLKLAPVTAMVSPEQIDAAFDAAQMRGNEGLMLKSLASTYQPGRRGAAWLKLKRELATLDVVVTAVEYGHGRRARVLSDYTFAVQDGAELKNVGKAYSGLTDEEISTLTQWFLEHRLDDSSRWQLPVEPKVILEVAFNNVMRSERHNSGYALRFPRIVRVRGDKPVSEIDTLERVAEIFRSQTKGKKPGEG